MNILKSFIVACLFISAAIAQVDNNTLNTDLKKLNIKISADILKYNASAKKGEKIAASKCMSCHGKAMLAVMSNYPSLQGQKGAYLVKQLLEFKQGQRKNLIMQPQANSLSFADIKDVALYFSNQPITQSVK